MSEVLTAFGVGLGGVVVGTVLNYFILRRLFSRQAKGVLDEFQKLPITQEVSEMVHQFHEWSKTEEAKGMMKGAYKALFGEEIKV